MATGTTDNANLKGRFIDYTWWLKKQDMLRKPLEAIYVQIDQKLFKDEDDKFTVRVAHNVGKTVALIEAGFEYVTGEYCDGGKIFRKRK
jgi:hypothetical protein